MHARPAGQLVKTAEAFNSAISLTKCEDTVDAKRLFALMGLAIKCGDAITISCEGEDEDAAANTLKAFFLQAPYTQRFL